MVIQATVDHTLDARLSGDVLLVALQGALVALLFGQEWSWILTDWGWGRQIEGLIT